MMSAGFAYNRQTGREKNRQVEPLQQVLGQAVTIFFPIH